MSKEKKGQHRYFSGGNMSKEKTIYAQLRAIDNKNDTLLVSFRNDLLENDRKILLHTKTGDELLWILRDHGTETYHLPHTFRWDAYAEVVEQTFANKLRHLKTNYYFARYWIKEVFPHREYPYKFFHIKVARPQYGTVVEVSHTQALELIDPMPVLTKEVQAWAINDAKQGCYHPPRDIDDQLINAYIESYKDAQKIVKIEA